MKEKYKKMLKSDEFTTQPIDLDPGKVSAVKGSTTFKIEADTPARVESDFRIGGGTIRMRAKAIHMEKVSKLFDEIDDDLKPYDGEIDLNDLQDADKVAEKPPSKPKSDISDAKSSNNMSKMISKSRKKSKKQMNFNFNEKPTLNEDVGFALLGKRRNMEVIDLEHDSISEERRSNSSKHESEAVVNIFKIKDLKAIVSS